MFFDAFPDIRIKQIGESSNSYGGSMAKYDPIFDYLKKMERKGRLEWNTSFSNIESLIQDRLPASAYKYREWWANEQSDNAKVQCHAWVDAGWKTTSVNLRRRTITFTKVTPTFTKKKHFQKYTD